MDNDTFLLIGSGSESVESGMDASGAGVTDVTIADSSSAVNVTARFAFALKCLDFFNFYYLAIIIIFRPV